MSEFLEKLKTEFPGLNIVETTESENQDHEAQEEKMDERAFTLESINLLSRTHMAIEQAMLEEIQSERAYTRQLTRLSGICLSEVEALVEKLDQTSRDAGRSLEERNQALQKLMAAQGDLHYANTEERRIRLALTCSEKKCNRLNTKLKNSHRKGNRIMNDVLARLVIAEATVSPSYRLKLITETIEYLRAEGARVKAPVES